MSWPTDDTHRPATPPLTRRELRERERLTEGTQASQATTQPQGDDLSALFGSSAPQAPVQQAAAQQAAAQQAPVQQVAAQQPALPAAPQPAPTAGYPTGAQQAGFIYPTSTSYSAAASAPPPPLRPSTGAKRKPAPRVARRRPMTSRLLSLAALLFAGTLVVGMSLPANAFYDPSTAVAEPAADSGDLAAKAADLQSVNVASNVQAVSTVRDAISVMSWAEVLKQRYGTRDFSYSVGTGPIRWPFPFAVPIASGFGDRIAPCRGCSSHHMGVDFDPGLGAAIFAIADGVVIEHSDDVFGFGNHVIIQHWINGVSVTSLYAHMQHGSVPLNVGDEVKVGDFVGLVGQTGTATGPHLHLEIKISGVNVDPFAWLKANAS